MAVYTQVEEADLRACLRRYGIGDLVGWRGIEEGVENSNFLIETTSGRFILTLYEKRVDVADLPFFLGLMEHLAERQIPCPIPLHDQGGANLTELSGRPAALITFLCGKAVMRPTARHCEALGRAVAALHLAGGDHPGFRANALAPQAWHNLFAESKARANEVQPGLAAELALELDALAARWPQDLPTGVIHADLFPDNVFFIDDEVSGVIDFYFACVDAYAYDLAICLNAWCFELDGSFNITKARAMTRGYTSLRPLSDREVAALPVLCRGATMRFLLTRLFDWLNRVDGALVVPKDPLEYLSKNRFHRGIAGPGAYGLG